jgi:RNA recognition motif-containing protein
LCTQDGSGKSKCFGFVNFSEPEAAGKAVDELTGREVNGKSLYAGRAQKKAEREAMLRSQFEEKRAERVQKYQVGGGGGEGASEGACQVEGTKGMLCQRTGDV